jgi:hypothetical protein
VDPLELLEPGDEWHVRILLRKYYPAWLRATDRILALPRQDVAAREETGRVDSKAAHGASGVRRFDMASAASFIAVLVLPPVACAATGCFIGLVMNFPIPRRWAEDHTYVTRHTINLSLLLGLIAAFAATVGTAFFLRR